jgi:hypothetical protein
VRKPKRKKLMLKKLLLSRRSRKRLKRQDKLLLLRQLPPPKPRLPQRQKLKPLLKLQKEPRQLPSRKLKLSLERRPKSSGQAQEESLLTNW